MVGSGPYLNFAPDLESYDEDENINKIYLSYDSIIDLQDHPATMASATREFKSNSTIDECLIKMTNISLALFLRVNTK